LEFEEDCGELNFWLGGVKAIFGDLKIRDFVEVILECLLEVIGFTALRLRGDGGEAIGKIFREPNGEGGGHGMILALLRCIAM
jgi:hypothetical protein